MQLCFYVQLWLSHSLYLSKLFVWNYIERDQYSRAAVSAPYWVLLPDINCFMVYLVFTWANKMMMMKWWWFPTSFSCHSYTLTHAWCCIYSQLTCLGIIYDTTSIRVRNDCRHRTGPDSINEVIFAMTSLHFRCKRALF